MDEKTCDLISDVENLFYDVHRGIRAINAAALAREFTAVTYVSDSMFEDVKDLEKKVFELIGALEKKMLGGEADAKG